MTDDRGSGTEHPASVTITPVLVAQLLVEDGRMPVCVHLIEHPQGRVLVDTGFTATHPLIADFEPILLPLDRQRFDLDAVDHVVNTHLHFDHCGGNHLFGGTPVHVQRAELEDARTLEDYTIPEWVDVPGVQYVEHDGDFEVLPGVRVLPAPGHTRGSQIVVVETEGGVVVIAGDTAVRSAELDEPTTEGQHLIRSLEPAAVWMAHEHEPWRPPTR